MEGNHKIILSGRHGFVFFMESIPYYFPNKTPLINQEPCVILLLLWGFKNNNKTTQYNSFSLEERGFKDSC